MRLSEIANPSPVIKVVICSLLYKIIHKIYTLHFDRLNDLLPINADEEKTRK
jgi:hypothetical protein